MGRVEKGWLDGPLPYDEDGQMLTRQGTLKVNPAFRFGAHQKGKPRVVGDLKGSRANAAAAVHTPVNLST